MEFWIALWKLLFIGGLAVFTGLAVWVTIFGFKDIRKLLERIAAQHQSAESE